MPKCKECSWFTIYSRKIRIEPNKEPVVSNIKGKRSCSAKPSDVGGDTNCMKPGEFISRELASPDNFQDN